MAQVITSYEAAGQLILSIMMDNGKMVLLDIKAEGAGSVADMKEWQKAEGPKELLVRGNVQSLGAD